MYFTWTQTRNSIAGFNSINVNVEKLVVKLLVRMGYGGSIKDAGQAIGCSGDGGVYGIINEDKLGLDKVYIQAKKWLNNV